MKKIRLRDTKPELALRKALTKLGFRYRLHSKNLPGKPDIVMRKHMLVIFIDGEFWHGYQWDQKKAKIKANREYWIPKIERTIERDKTNTQLLKEMGFTVFRFWEHQVRKDLDTCLSLVLKHCQSTNQPAL